jgi:hypothetical protein
MPRKQEVSLPRKYRLTCARTTYFDVELSAEDIAEAERLVEVAFAGGVDLVDGVRPLGQPLHRIVEIAAQEDVAAALHEAAA